MPIGIALSLVALAILSVVCYYWGKSGKYQTALAVVCGATFVFGLCVAVPTWWNWPYSQNPKSETGQLVGIILLPFCVPVFTALWGAARNKSQQG